MYATALLYLQQKLKYLHRSIIQEQHEKNNNNVPSSLSQQLSYILAEIPKSFNAVFIILIISDFTSV